MTLSSLPNQAVILCGGLGTRLRPFTDSLPKPMVPVNGKPFLYHLLLQLSEQGLTSFLLLTGYLGEKISSYFGDGSNWGWKIEYSHGPAEWDTGRRLWEARERFEARFMLFYSDNFVQFKLEKLKQLHHEHAVPISLLLAPKTKGNIKASADGRIEDYDNSRAGVGFDYVEVGYMIIERDAVLADFPSYTGFPDFSFSALIKKLARHSNIAGLVVRDAYHSISDPERLKLSCEYLKPKRILLLDRDGVINKKAAPGEYIANWNQFSWIPETRSALERMAREGFKFIVITNQAGIARKMIDPKALEDIHSRMAAELATAGIDILKIYVSPHHWNENSFMRKPEPGMFFHAAKDFNLRMDRCLYVGDDERDCQAANNAGCGMVFVSSAPVANTCKEQLSVLQVPTVLEAVENIKNTYLAWENAA